MAFLFCININPHSYLIGTIVSLYIRIIDFISPLSTLIAKYSHRIATFRMAKSSNHIWKIKIISTSYPQPLTALSCFLNLIRLRILFDWYIFLLPKSGIVPFSYCFGAHCENQLKCVRRFPMKLLKYIWSSEIHYNFYSNCNWIYNNLLM